jgi:parallel beta-helix repeat protein
MKKLAVAGVIVLFFCSSVPALAYSNEKTLPSVEGNAFYVGGSGPGNFTDIQSAVDAAIDGDSIVVFPQTYRESVTIDKQLVLRGVNVDGNLPVINGGRKTVFSLTVRHADCLVENFIFIRSRCGGIDVVGNHTTIRNCSISKINVGPGIQVNGRGNSIENNVISQCGRGLIIVNSYNSTIANNTIMRNSFGLLLEDSREDRIVLNQIAFNNRGIATSSTSEDIQKNNIVRNLVQARFFNSHDDWASNYWGPLNTKSYKVIFGGEIVSYPVDYGIIFYYFKPLITLDKSTVHTPYGIQTTI